MYEIDGIFTMKERIRATALTAGLALFLLAACGAQEAVDKRPTLEDIDAPEEVSEEDIDVSRQVIEQPLPDEDIADINVIIKDASEMQADVSDAQTENEKRPVLGEQDTDSQDADEQDIDEQDIDAQVVKSDINDKVWFEESGKTLTPAGKFDLFTAITNDDFTQDISEEKVECTMDITTIPAQADGYKTIVATLMLDCDKGLVWEMVPFDKYTGMAMVIHRLGYGENECKGNVTVRDKSYDVEYTVDIGRGSDGRSSSVYKVTVPEEYDGLMFYVGYANAEIAAKDDTYLKEAMLLSDMPSWGSPSEFFFAP